jgi:hypothetical protein
LAVLEGGDARQPLLGGCPAGECASLLVFVDVVDAKTVKNRIHLDLAPEDASQDQEVDRIQALIVDRQLGVPSWQEQFRPRPVPAGRTGLQAAGRQDVPSVADRQLRIARDRKNISAHFASAALVAGQYHAVDSTRTAAADPNSRILGAGISQVALTSVTVSGITATIVARAHEWTSSVVREQAVGNWLDVSPAADTIYNAKLSIGPSGTRLATDMIGRLANGSGP